MPRPGTDLEQRTVWKEGAKLLPHGMARPPPESAREILDEMIVREGALVERIVRLRREVHVD
jgi:hypothetical protein